RRDGGPPRELRGHGPGRHRRHAPGGGHQDRSAHRLPRHPLRLRRRRGGAGWAASPPQWWARWPSGWRRSSRCCRWRPPTAPRWASSPSCSCSPCGRAASWASAPSDMENYLIAMGTFAGLYALLALGLNLVWGMTGMINLGLVGFYAVGAYVSALLTKKAGWPMWAGLLAAMLLTAVA